MVKEVLLPDLGEGIDGADVSEVVVSVGDTVSKEDTLLVLESDKASMEIPAEDAGVIKEILVSPGDSLETGALLMRVEVKTSPKESSLEEKPGLGKQEAVQDNDEHPAKAFGRPQRVQRVGAGDETPALADSPRQARV